MDFGEVVQRARELHVEGKPSRENADDIRLTEEVYGRICTSPDSGPPKNLATSAGRKTVFLFGPDAVSSIILKQNAYDACLSLGFDRAYISPSDLQIHAHNMY